MSTCTHNVGFMEKLKKILCGLLEGNKGPMWDSTIKTRDKW